MIKDNTPDSPSPFLKIRASDFKVDPKLVAMCVGYENGEWREEQLIEHALEWLPEFALKHSEWNSLGAANAVKLIRKAAKSIYKTEKFEKRGEVWGTIFAYDSKTGFRYDTCDL